MDAVGDVDLPPFDAEFVGTEILREHVVEHRFHLLFGQQVDRRGGEEVGAVVNEDADFRTALVEEPRVVAVSRQYGVDAHFADGALDEAAQGRLLALVEGPFGQLVAARGAELLLLGDQLVATAALHLELRAVHLAERVEQLAQRLHADTEAHVVGLRELADRHADHLVAVVEHRAARIAGVHRGVGLEVVLSLHELPGGGDGAFGDGEGHSVGVSRDVDLAAYGDRLVVGQRDFGQSREVPLGGQQRDVQQRIDHDHVRQVGVAVVVVDRHGAVTLDDVVVGDEQVARLEVEAAARPARVGHLEDRLKDIVFHGMCLFF